jgi:hypothetical protein
MTSKTALQLCVTGLVNLCRSGSAASLSTEEQHQFLGYADTLAKQGVPQVCGHPACVAVTALICVMVQS